MPTFEVEPEEILVFDLGEEYAFSHYFEREDLFEALREYYDRDAYRFEVPKDELEVVREVLADAHYELTVVEDLEPYCVVKEQYTEHAEILRDSVAHWTRRGYNFFLVKDDLAVRAAVERGATPVAETDLVVGI